MTTRRTCVVANCTTAAALLVEYFIHLYITDSLEGPPCPCFKELMTPQALLVTIDSVIHLSDFRIRQERKFLALVQLIGRQK